MSNITDREFQEKISEHIADYANVITVYEKPKDYPDKYVARLFLVNSKVKPTKIFIVKDTLKEVRNQIPASYIRMSRSAEDDPVIYETYLW